MSSVARVESLWRYPVKSMRGEELDEAFVGVGGMRGDRLCAFHSSAARPEFPYFTARQQPEMLRYRPRLDGPERKIIEVQTPDGATFAIDDPALIDLLRRGVDEQHRLTLIRSQNALADCHPVSIISLRTVRKLAAETALPPEKRRFRANIYLELHPPDDLTENDFVGRSLRVGSELVISIVARDARCMMITLDPDTAEIAPSLLKQVAQAHGGTAGVYGTVLKEGTIRKGDQVELVDLSAKA